MNLNIQNPCTENWNNMTSTDNGKYCSSCKKTVVDIRSKSNLEIKQLINDNNSVCVISNKRQLNNHTYYRPTKRLAFALLIVFGNALFPLSAKAQETTEKLKETYLNDTIQSKVSILGNITDANGEPLPFANIIIYKNNVIVKGTTSDLDGNYTINLNEDDFNQKYDLVVSFIGYQEIRIVDYVIENNTLTQNFQMKEDHSNFILGMIIYDPPIISKDPSDANKTTFKREEIQRSPNR